MRKAFLIVLMLVCVPVAFAAEDLHSALESAFITFDILPDNTVDQKSFFYFNRTMENVTLVYPVNEPVKNIIANDANGNIRTELVDTGGNFTVQMTIVNQTRNLTLSYRVDGAIFTDSSMRHFFTQFAFGRQVKRLGVRVMLPPSYAIYQNAYLPTDAKIGSDGKKIMLEWQKSNVNSVLISVKFAPAQDNAKLWMIIPAMIALSAFSIVTLYVYFDKRTKEAFLKGFRDDEQKAINLIKADKIMLQSKLHSEFNFSRAKATRIIMKLEEKNLINKEKYGRTNKISWISK